MTKKNDKRLCWNCEGNVSHHISQCPYCGVDVTQPIPRDETQIFKGFSSPFKQNAQQEIPRPPYSPNQTKDLTRISHAFSDSSHTLHDDLAPQMGEAVSQEHCPRPFEGQSRSAERRSVQKKCAKSGLTVSEEEWKLTMDEPQDFAEEDQKKENIALLLLIPGVVFLLFGLALTFFSRDGVMVLKWNQDIAYFYFLGAIPLLLLGWRALRK